MINAETKTIFKILQESTTYVIPEYQRPFAWKIDQAQEFWEDLKEGPAFLGTFVFEISRIDDGEIVVVDGQQRLTTIFIFLSACAQQLLKLKAADSANAIWANLISKDRYTGKKVGTKLRASKSIRDVFEETITNPDWINEKFEAKGKKRQIAKIKPIYNFFADKISDYSQQEIVGVMKHLYDSNVVQIGLNELTEAFQIFERTNARGVDLNTADLVKNFLFSHAGKSTEVLNDKWNSIVEDSSGNIQRMLKYFYVSKRGNCSRKDLFRKLKSYAIDITVPLFVDELKEFSRVYSLVVNPRPDNLLEWADEFGVPYFQKQYAYQNLDRKFLALKLFNISSAHPLIVKLMNFLAAESDQTALKKMAVKFEKLLDAIEKTLFANYAICSRPGNQIEPFFISKAHEVTRENFVEHVGTVIQALKSQKLVKFAEFSEKFQELNYQLNKNYIYYIFDRLNNWAPKKKSLKGGQYIEIYKPDSRIVTRNYDIEHLFPQDDSAYELDFGGIKTAIHGIGNLLVISKHTNGEMQNKILSDKIEIMKEKENLREVAMLCDAWANVVIAKIQIDEVAELIHDRSRELAKRAYDFASAF